MHEYHTNREDNGINTVLYHTLHYLIGLCEVVEAAFGIIDRIKMAESEHPVIGEPNDTDEG